MKDEILQAVTKALEPFLDRGLLLAVVTFSIRQPSEQLENYAITLIPRPSTDHEDKAIRDNAARQISEISTKLTKQVYGI